MKTSVLACFAALLMSGPAGAQQPAGEFVFRPGDVLRLSVWPDSSYSGSYAVEEDGRVHLPLVGVVQAAGQSVVKIRTDLRERFGREMQQPVVTVIPLFRVGVVGEVNRPGLYTIDPTHSFMELIALAGGFNERAKTDDVRVLRDGQVIRINAQQGLETLQRQHELVLQSGDQVIVPRRRSLNVLTLFYIAQSAVVIASLFSR